MVSKAEAIREAAAVVEEKPVEEVILSNGLILKLKPVPQFLIQRAAQRVPKPSAPIVHLEDKGRDEENPDDPKYLEDLQAWEFKVIEVSLNVLLAAGTEIISTPVEMSSVDDDGWLEFIQFFDIEVDTSTKISRYLSWLLCYALAGDDLSKVIGLLMSKSGLSEAEVNATLDTFRNRAARRANNGVSAKAT